MTTKPTITMRRNGNLIEFLSSGGAVVAYLDDCEDLIQFDPLAASEEAMGLVNYRDVIAELGLTPSAARSIVTAGNRMGRIHS